ncbi:MAG: heavy metal translocating P-type ATPase [Chloroflexi bacterium HGW-Chloroflexi-3]|nr:MAG: heavy metal translocating P-type ATPase [Chloroflexi bacterium HGW-Chloroflexi-3]
MKVLTNWYIDPKQRRKILTILSGSLILVGLAARLNSGLLDLGNALLVIAAVTAGSDIVGRAWVNLRNKAFSIELLVSIAFIGALVIGEYWEAAAVTFLFIFGAYLEARTLSRTREVLGDLLDLVPTKALILRDGRQIEVSAHEVVIDDVLLIKPGTKVPVDGKVIEGVSAVDESAITGEPIPEEKSEGDLVFAGSVNQNGIIKIRTTGIGSDTTLARIIQRVEQAQEEKAPTQRFIERFAQWYTPAIIALSIIAFVLSRDIELSLTLLVIGCPGALVISTPVSIVAGIGRAAKKGILIKGGEYLENAGKINVVALDKTGTLTQGKPQLVEIQVVDDLGAPILSNGIKDHAEKNWSDEQRQILHWAGIAEVNSEHPLARPILAEANRFEMVPEPDEFELLVGKGVVAQYQGKQIGVGTSVLMQSLNILINSEAQKALELMKSDGKTAVLVSIDEKIIGILGIADPIRENARELVSNLRKIGIHKVVMVTGDDRITADAIAGEVGIVDVHANLLPEGKLEIIEKFKKDGHVVAMIGDGINDAPALATADIGIAMGVAGTGIAIETADIALMADDLLKIPQAIALSKAVLRNIRQNVVVALVTVSALLAGVLLKEVHMAGGMLIHQASVLLVIVNGMRLLRE